MNENRIDRIHAALDTRFKPERLSVEDQSHLHAGHAGAATGRGHFRVEIIAQAFDGMAPLARHRAVFDALGEMMQTDIHALSVTARTPAEVAG